jgi:predicted ATPase/class 3 adenylate cyclase
MTDYRALLLTDVVDSTKLSEQIGNEAMAEVWSAHDRVARDLLRQAGGREIDKTDGMLLMFDHAADATDYALAYHRALAALPVPLLARAGLHVGPVILRENSAADVALGAKPLEVDGLAKPTAARVMSLARGGQLLMTAEAREALGKSRLRVKSHGYWVMKGLAEPIELFEAGDHDAPFRAPSDGDKGYRVVRSGDRWLSIDELPNNLPQQITSFIGRERELGEAKVLLGSVRLLTLLGMGGLGKTRLSLQVATEVRHHYPDGCWFVDLAPVRDAALVVSETAQALGVREEPDRPLLQSVCAFVKARRLLLILDNCEHVVKASADLASALLRAAPEVRVLASSREALRVPGEQIYPVLPMPVPRAGDSFELLSQTAAVRLFMDRARLQKPNFEFTPREAPAIGELVARLEGIPLALELAAARVRSLSVADINARLKDRYKLLTGGGRVLMERQQTLRALVDWSYDLLNAQEQTLLNRLAVFAGGFDLAAAEAVSGTDPLDSADVLDLLGSLVEKSLVTLDEQDEEARYRMLETIRDYAREKLEASGGLAATAARHCDHFFAVAKAVRDGIKGADQALWIRRAETDLDNLRVAMALPLSGGADPFIAVKFAVALQDFWILRGYTTEGRNAVRAALALPAVQASDLAQSWALYVGATQAYCQSDHTEARGMLETCLELRRRLGNPLDIAATLSTLSMVRLQSADAVGAAQGETEALEIFRSLGERYCEAVGLCHLAEIALYTDDHAQATACAQASLQIGLEIEHREAEGESELLLGEIALETDNLVSARTHFARSLAVSNAAGDRRGVANATWWLAKVDLADRDVFAAHRRLADALQAFRKFEMREELLSCLEDCAAVAMAAGVPQVAAQLAGLTEKSRERLELIRAPRHQRRWLARKQTIENALDPAALAQAWAQGRDWDADQGIHCALGLKV